MGAALLGYDTPESFAAQDTSSVRARQDPSERLRVAIIQILTCRLKNLLHAIAKPPLIHIKVPRIFGQLIIVVIGGQESFELLASLRSMQA